MPPQLRRLRVFQYNARKGQYVFDFHRVAIHEFGHTLGLAHPDDNGQTVTAIMNRNISNLDSLAADDISGIKFLYSPRITSGLIEPNVLVGDSFIYQITANNNPTSYATSNLPSELQVNTAGIISGIFSHSGTYNINIAAKGAGGWAIDALKIIVVGPFITSQGLRVQAGDPISYQLSVTSPAGSFEASGLPLGLHLNSSTGLITGKVTVAGNYPVSIIAHTAVGDATATINIQLFAPYITSLLYPPAIHLGDSITYQITATNRPSSFDAQDLPAGLHLSSVSGQISGTPTLVRSFSSEIVAHGTIGDATDTIHITVLPAIITSALVPPPTLIGDSFLYQITASNHPTSFTASGLPAGLSLDPFTGLISGIPTLTGTYTVSITGHGVLGDLTGSIQIAVQPGDPTVDALVATLNLGQYGEVYDIVSDPQRSRIYIGCDKGLSAANNSEISIQHLRSIRQ